jgi:cytochrome c5
MKTKLFILVMIVLLTSALVVGCGGGGSTTPTPTPPPTTTPEPTPSLTGTAIPADHAGNDIYKNCMMCHGSNIEESHSDFADFEESCLDCHEQS